MNEAKPLIAEERARILEMAKGDPDIEDVENWLRGYEATVAALEAELHDLCHASRPMQEMTKRAESAEARCAELEAGLRDCLPYVTNWLQANEEGWIDKKARVLAAAERLLAPVPKETT